MSELIKKQNYGVEVEFTGITRQMAADAVAQVLGSHSISGPDHSCYQTRTITDSKSLKLLVNFMYSRQDIIYDALQVGKRKDHWCRPICQKLNVAMKKERDLSKSKMEGIWYSKANDNYYGGIDHSHYNETRYHAFYVPYKNYAEKFL